MQNNYADAGCVLRINVTCEACKMKLMEVIHSIVGAYNVNIDGDEGLVRISGEVDPNLLIQALGRTGRHAELVRANISHPQVNTSNHASIDNGQSNIYGALDNVYGSVHGIRALTDGEHYQRPYGCTDNCCRPLPPATYVPSYPSWDYDPVVDDQRISFCSVM